jgi:hypothetical protein
MAGEPTVALLPQHLDKLRSSAISVDAVQARGYESLEDTPANHARLEELGFRPYQRRLPGLLIPVWTCDGTVGTYQLRPDQPRSEQRNGKPRVIKYESPAGRPLRICVPPAAKQVLADPQVTLVITEGALKADSALSAGIQAIAVTGVYGWSGAEARQDLDKIVWQKRRVLVAFDSDVATNEDVAKAELKLAEFLAARGADLWGLRLPPNGTDKQGLDDWLAAGGTREELLGLVVRLNAPQPRLLRVSDVEPKPVEWLWKHRIPLGKVTILDGDPGVAKSLFSLDLTARVTTGRALPDGSSPVRPAPVILLTVEDDAEDTIRPRLEAAGADLRLVYTLNATSWIPTLGEDGSGDLQALKSEVERVRPVLVVLDPLNSFLSGRVNAFRDHEIRRALNPLTMLAQDCRIALLTIRHLTKGSESNPLYRGGGSIGIIGAARSGLLMTRHPDDQDKRVLAVTKSNLGPEAPSLTFHLEHVQTSVGEQPRVVWDGAVKYSAAELLDGGDRDRAPRRSEAMDVIIELLKDGDQPAKECEEELKEAGFSSRVWRPAKERLNVKSYKEKGVAHGRWMWHLPMVRVIDSDLQESPTQERGDS